MLKIAVNSRIQQNTNSGIPYYIAFLYRTLQAEMHSNVTFLQTRRIKELGNTLVRTIPDGDIGAVLFDVFLVRKVFIKSGADVLHGPANVLPWFRVRNKKYVLTVHDLAFVVLPQVYARHFRWYWGLTVRRSVKIADRIIAVSENTKNDLIKYYSVDPTRIDIVYPGLNEFIFEANRSGAMTTKENYVFSLTTHPKRKNIFNAVRAFAQISSVQNYDYLIAGIIPDDQKGELMALAAELGVGDRVKLIGYVDETKLVELYQKAALFIYPSFYEGFGMPLLEAMASSCIVVAGNNSSMIEIVQDDAMLVDPYDVKNMADKMSSLLGLDSHKRSMLINANLERAKQFSWRNSAIQQTAVFEKMERD